MAVGEGGRDNGVQELINTTASLGNKNIDLSRKNLTEIPSEVLNLQQLEFLYLEGNYITDIPDCLFERLPSLKWLDLRNNHITEVPAAIGSHKALRNLLLEGNGIKELPLELGFAKLSGLNIASNPLEMPPSYVIEKGTQEVLKFLREKYASKMQLDETQAALGVSTASASSSEEDLIYNSHDNQIAVHLPEEEKAPVHEDDIKVEKVRLPPIFQAAAERPRHRTVDESNEILRGQKSTQFEPKPKTRLQISEPEIRMKSPQRQRHDETRRIHSPPKQHTVSPEERSNKRISYSRSKKYTDTTLRNSFELQEVERMEEKTEKPNRKKRSRGHSPAKSNIQPNKKLEKIASLDLENSPVKQNEEIIKITTKTTELKVSDVKHESKDIKLTQKEETKKKETTEQRNKAQEVRDMTKMSFNPSDLHLNEGDFVAIKVPSKLYIKGQPCLGKITTMEDNLGLLTVHYYTGTYEGYWRPMMSRTSPYLRKVPNQSILCKFKLSSDGRMSPITRAKVKQTVDGGQNQQH